MFKTSRFATFNEIKDEIDKRFPGQTLSTRTSMRLVSKHCTKSRIHKHKPFISQINLTYHMQWAKTMGNGLHPTGMMLYFLTNADVFGE